MGMLAMAVAGLNFGGPSTATEFSSVTAPEVSARQRSPFVRRSAAVAARGVGFFLAD
jgi:hypothetical protein